MEPAKDVQTPELPSVKETERASPAVLEILEKTPTASAIQDDGLMERYNKLKSIAVKLKKKIAEQTTEIESLREDKSRFQNASKIQQEFDKAQDEIERLKLSERNLKKDLERAVGENVNLKMSKAETESQFQTLSSSHKSIKDKLDKLELEQGTDSVEILQGKVESLDKELKECKEAGQSALMEKRQLQILQLEVTDYEKKLQDAYGSFEEKKAEIQGIMRELGDKEAKIEDLETKVGNYRRIEDQLLLAKDSLQADVSRKADKITFLQDELTKWNEKGSELKTELQKTEQSLEILKSNFSSQTKEWNDRHLDAQRVVLNLETKIVGLEENKRSRETQISNLKLEMGQLESDYLSYKTKAQAMLKSQKPVVPDRDHEEIENLQRAVQSFHSEVTMLKSDLHVLKMENGNLSMERAELNVRLNKLKADSMENELHMNEEIQKLKFDIRQKDDELRARAEASKQELESVVNDFSNKISSLKKGYEDTVQSLREKLELSKWSSVEANEALKAQTHLADFSDSLNAVHLDEYNADTVSARINNKYSPASSGENDSQLRNSQPLTIDTVTGMSFEQLKMIPRGEGEGSESVVSSYTPRARPSYDISFEQLLSTSLDSFGKGNDWETEHMLQKAVTKLKEELIRSQTQTHHVTSLLRESEANCDRLSQLCEALKEEIRKIERDKERQEHLKENTEYLKNVILKFVTLTGEPERERLIPVLKTMLKLTPDEVSRLEAVAKGRNLKEGPSWSSYLPLWSGSEK